MDAYTEQTAIAQKIAVMRAYENGAAIEYRDLGCRTWKRSLDPTWNWHLNEYRIKKDKKKLWIAVSTQKTYGNVHTVCNARESKEALAASLKSSHDQLFGGWQLVEIEIEV